MKHNTYAQNLFYLNSFTICSITSYIYLKMWSPFKNYIHELFQLVGVIKWKINL
jgi:hypothetical protein